MPILINITGDDPSSGESVLRWSTGAGFVSSPTSSPANTRWQPRLIQAGNFERHLFRPGQTFGESSVGYGEVVVNNADRGLDPILEWAFDGRPLEIWRGPRTGEFPADFTLILRGTMEGVEVQDRRKLVFRLRDRRAEVSDRLLHSETYAGNNALPAGLEGAEGDIKGQYKPEPYGVVRNAALPICNTSKIIAQAARRAVQSIAVSATYDRGASLTADAAFSTLADVQDDTKAPVATHWKAYLGSANEGAYVRLGSTPNGEVTADITEGNAARDRYAARVMARMLTDAGMGVADVVGYAPLDSVAPWVVGHWTGNAEPKAGEALDRIAASIHGFWLPDRLGRVVIGRLDEPAGPPKLIIEPWMILNNGNALARTVNALEGIPVWRVTVRYQRNWTVQDKNSLAGVALADVLWRSQEYRSITVTDQSVKDRHPLAREITLDTALDAAVDAQSLADFMLRLYRVRRDIYEIGLPTEQSGLADLADAVMLRAPRFDLLAGKLFRVIGIAEDLARNRATLTLWG